MPFKTNHTYGQMLAIEKYKARLAEIPDPEELRKQAVAIFSQNLSMHNTYHSIINNHLAIEQKFLDSLTEK
jgi:hypothetical protein